MKPEVCVTGVGVVSSIGHGQAAFWNNLIAGRSGITEVTSFDTSNFSVHLGGEIKDFNPTRYKINRNNMGRCSQLAIAACGLAFENAGLSNCDTRKIAVILGTTLGETQTMEEIDRLWLKGEDKISSDLIRQLPPSNISYNVSDYFGLQATSMVIPNACAAGNFAISYACDLIRQGEYDIVVAGGAEAMSKIAFTGFNRIFAIAPDKCRPFDINRHGIMVGEGAGVLILEDEKHARRRGARIYCAVQGYGLSADANNMIIPDEEGIYSSMARALEDAHCDKSKVDYICAHGTGTRANDLAEAKAIARLFGSRSNGDSPLVTSIKSMLGHTMGAASAIEAIACILSIDTGVIPPTINLEEQDPECDISCVANTARKSKVRTVLNNAFAFGGNNSCVVFHKDKDL